MSRRDDERRSDVLASAGAILAHLGRGDLRDGLVFDAVRVRVIEIGEAVKDIDPALLKAEPGVVLAIVVPQSCHSGRLTVVLPVNPGENW